MPVSSFSGSSEWLLIDSDPDDPFVALYAYETGYDEGDSTLVVSCYDFYDPPRVSFYVVWDSYVSILDDLPVYLSWDSGEEIREPTGWDSLGDSDGIRPPSAHAASAFLDRLLDSSHLEVRAHGYEIVSAKFNTVGFSEVVQPVVEICQ